MKFSVNSDTTIQFLQTRHNSPVEFARNLGKPRKNSYRNVLYTVGKVILSAFLWWVESNFSLWAKKVMNKRIKGGRNSNLQKLVNPKFWRIRYIFRCRHIMTSKFHTKLVNTLWEITRIHKYIYFRKKGWSHWKNWLKMWVASKRRKGVVIVRKIKVFRR